MKSKILSLLPNQWNDSADIRAMLLTLIVLVGILVLKSAFAIGEAKAFLVSGFVAVLAIYWIPPIPAESYVRWIATHTVLLFGVFLFLFKIPSLFSSFLSYGSAQIISILVYCICCWFLMRQKKRTS
jgi:hypothetical protein